MTDRELMQQTLDLLEEINQCSLPPTGIPLPAEIDYVMEALRARLAQPEPEELGEIIPADEEQLKRIAKLVEQHPLWIRNEAGELQLHAPPQREWQGLTDENEIKHCWYEACQTDLELTSQLVVYFARAIEAKLKEKNNG